jgi:hypothetical protein
VYQIEENNVKTSQRSLHAPLAYLIMLTQLVFTTMASGDIVTTNASDGGQLQYDGVYYDYRDDNAQKGMKLWVPPGAEPVRGIIFHGNPGGGGGDTRDLCRDRALQEFAARYHFGIIGVTWFPSRLAFSDKCATFLRALEDWARMGFHPELTNVPLIVRGSSNAGMTAYNWLRFAPERLICSTPNVGATRYQPYPEEAGLRVPMLKHIGPVDPFFPLGLKDTAEMFRDLRPKGARWAWTAEQGKGHEIRHINDINFCYYDTCIKLRVPEDWDPRSGPVQLRDLPEESGWLADTLTWRRSGVTHVAPWSEYDRYKATADWLPTKDIAYLYAGIATYDNPLELSVRDMGPVDNPYEQGSLLRSVGGNLVDPGTKVVLECEVTSPRFRWQRIEFYRGGEKIGEVEQGEEPKCELVVDGERTEYSFVAIGYDERGEKRTSYPIHFLVRDPAVSEQIDAQLATLTEPAPRERPAAGSAAQPGGEPAVTAPDKALVAYGLTAEQEQTFAAEEGKLSAFWSAITDAHHRACVSAKHVVDGNGGDDEACVMTVKAAHSRAGLYLLFQVNDDEWSAADDLNDAVDFHIARSGTDVIGAAQSVTDVYMTTQFSLTLDEVQYQANFGTPEKPGTELSRNIPSPWDMANVREPFDEVAGRHGIVIRQRELDDNTRAMEWFIPWDRVGSGGPMDEPAVGTRLGLVVGYNDTDGEETVSYRWPAGIDPWREVEPDGHSVACWGDMIIGPVVGK